MIQPRSRGISLKGISLKKAPANNNFLRLKIFTDGIGG
jgi:hypothetical protein